jgi:ketosteroid isomerase-like protein
MAISTTASEDVAGILHQLDTDFMARAKAGNAQACVEGFYAQDGCALPAHREIIRGHRALVTMWRGTIAAGLKDLSLETTQIDVHGDMAYGIGRYHMTVDPPGGPRTEQTGNYLVVYKRQPDGAWRAAADMFSPNK